MKDFYRPLIVAVFWVVALVCALVCAVISASILADDSMDIAHALKHGPFPEELPAGHLLVTADGKFNTLGPNHVGVWGFPEDTACEAVQWDWRILEAFKEDARERAVRIKPAAVAWKIVTKPDTGNWCDVTAK